MDNRPRGRAPPRGDDEGRDGNHRDRAQRSRSRSGDRNVKLYCFLQIFVNFRKLGDIFFLCWFNREIEIIVVGMITAANEIVEVAVEAIEMTIGRVLVVVAEEEAASNTERAVTWHATAQIRAARI